MKYSGTLDINKPRDVVSQLIIDSEYLGEWQDGFVKKELLEGEEGQDGAVSKMYYKMGDRDMILTETITKNDLPNSFEAFYHHKHMDNTMRYTFYEVGDSSMRMEFEYEYTRLNWIMPRLMAILFPAVYRKQGEKWMSQFKKFAENDSPQV